MATFSRLQKLLEQHLFQIVLTLLDDFSQLTYAAKLISNFHGLHSYSVGVIKDPFVSKHKA